MALKQFKGHIARAMPGLYQYRKERRQANVLIEAAKQLAQLTNSSGVKEMIEFVVNSKTFRASQQIEEINQLLTMVHEQQPKVLCEIGCYRGGTLFLLCQVAPLDATIISLDLAHDPKRVAAYRHFARGQQRLIFITGDTHNQETLARLKSMLEGCGMDFLFIDGDHSYEGVKADYEMYSPLVREGGVIAFHDIVADHQTRYGVPSKSYTGGVPEFWSDLKQQNPSAQEIIQDANQDGFGIGIVKRI